MNYYVSDIGNNINYETQTNYCSNSVGGDYYYTSYVDNSDNLIVLDKDDQTKNRFNPVKILGNKSMKVPFKKKEYNKMFMRNKCQN
jgi:hypothetical protein